MHNKTVSIPSTHYLISYLTFLQKKQKSGLNDFMKFRELKNIIDNHSLSTFFQPIIDLKTDRIIGYEALNRPPFSRWFPSTEHFYSYIGNTDQVFHFDLMCRTTSFKRFSSQVKQAQSEKDKLLFINIHPDVLVDSKYKPGETIQILEEYGIKPNQVVFELTEKKAVTDFEMFEKVVNNYRSQGFRLAIDDAGAGYNSLKTIVQLQPEFIKLDKSLIQNIVSNKVQQKMVSLLLDFANQCQSFVIAEGIEHHADLDYLKCEGIHFGQGYALGMPVNQITPET